MLVRSFWAITRPNLQEDLMAIDREARRKEIRDLLPNVSHDRLVKLIIQIVDRTEEVQLPLNVSDYPIGGGDEVAVEARHDGRVDLAEEIEDEVLDAVKAVAGVAQP
ncbi:hypothetical protein ABZ502_32700 [Streptomyces abikoensis]|uniref:hypothetical protein n=1 Tax=Streptomyces abikoensis TaxID=97398 RepID=UPI0033E80EE5